jgi:hypothetical protein
MNPKAILFGTTISRIRLRVRTVLFGSFIQDYTEDYTYFASDYVATFYLPA